MTALEAAPQAQFTLKVKMVILAVDNDMIMLLMMMMILSQRMMVGQ